MKGYKVFNPDWTCRGFQYEVGKTYEMNENIELCQKGFHFCERLIDCFNYYPLSEFSKIAEIEADGIILNEGNKSCANKIKIIREISYDEAFEIMEISRKSIDEMFLLFKETANLCARLGGSWDNGLGVGPWFWHLITGFSYMNRSINACLEGKGIMITIIFNNGERKLISILDNIITIEKDLLEISKEKNGIFEKYYIPTILKLFPDYEVKYV